MLKIFRLLANRISRTRQGKMWENDTRKALKRMAKACEKFWWKRIWDHRAWTAVNPQYRCMKQPADFMACAGGRLYMIECKSSMAHRYRLDNVKPHQERAMVEIERAGGVYWLVLLHRDRDGNDHHVYAFTYDNWMRLKDFTYTKKFLSATWDWITNFANKKLRRVHDTYGVWDFTPLFEECS